MSKKSESTLIRQNTIAGTIAEQAQGFLSDRRARQLSHGTIDFYSYYLDIFLDRCKEAGWASMNDLTPGAIRSLLDGFGASHNKGGVHALYRTVLALCNWYEKETEDDDPWRNPMRKVTAPKVKLDPIPGVSLDDVKRLADACGKGWYGRRDRALLLFLFDRGVRSGELLAVNLGYIDLSTGAVQVYKGKGDKDRVVFFGDEAAAELRRYLRGQSNDIKEAPLWLNWFGERMGAACLRDIIMHRAADAGLEELPSPHDFRRGFVLNMLRNGADLITVSRLLGHESLEVTKRYLALVEEGLERAHRKASPVDKMRQKRSL